MVRGLDSREFRERKALTKTLLGDNIPGRVKDINTPGTYLHNCEAIFVNHPELVEDLELSKLLPFVSADGNPKNPHLANLHPRADLCRFSSFWDEAELVPVFTARTASTGFT